MRSASALLSHNEVKRVALVVEDGCAACNESVAKYVAAAQGAKNATFAVDVFVRKTGNNDAVLRQWVSANKVPIALIQNKRITINHGDKYAQGAVPQVWQLRGDSQWTRER